MTENDGSEFDTREQVVQTERGFTLEVSHKRGTDVRDQDEVEATWHMEQKPPRDAFNALTRDVTATMAELREANESGDE